MLVGLPEKLRMFSLYVSIHSLAFLTFKIPLSDASLPVLFPLGFYTAKIPLSGAFLPVTS